MFTILSLSASKPDVTQYQWYKFTGARSVMLDHPKFTAEIAGDDVFGVKTIRVGVYHILHRDDTSIVFKADAKILRSLLTRSIPFKGKVNNIQVTPGKGAGTAGAKGAETALTVTQEPYEIEVEPKDKDLEKALKSCKLKGAEGIKFLMKMTQLTGEVNHFFDVSSVFNKLSADLKQDRAWERVVEDAVIAVTDKKYLVGAARYKYKGSMLPVVLIVEE